MIRRRPLNTLSSPPNDTTTTLLAGDDDDNKDNNDNDNEGKRIGLIRRRCCCLSSKFSAAVTTTTTAAAVFVFIVLIFVIAHFINSINTTESAFNEYLPNNNNNNNNIVNTTSSNDQASKGTTVSSLSFTVGNRTTADTDTDSISSSSSSSIEIPYIRYEPMNFKAIKARMDYATSNGGDANINNIVNNTIGQYLLDFGIIGFPKCGTTTMMRWLNRHDEIAVVGIEIMALQKHHPARILSYITRELPEGRYRRGYKSPSDVEDGRARNKLGIHYPKTKLLVGLRHPVLWYESFYNHRIQNGYKMPDLLTAIAESKGAIRKVCQGNLNGVCFTRANFHTTLARWGKTPLLSSLSLPSSSSSSSSETNSSKNYDDYDDYNNEDEWKLFTIKEQRSLRTEVNKTEISPNPIFLYDVSQLQMPTSITADGNNDENNKQDYTYKYYNDFILSLQEFLGVSKNVSAMPPMIRESPGKIDGINETEQLRRTALKIDLCEDKYEVPRGWLLESGSNIHLWIQNYFVKSPHNVFVGGGIGIGIGGGDASSSQFLKLLESYGKDPCPERRRKQQQKSKQNE